MASSAAWQRAAPENVCWCYPGSARSLGSIDAKIKTLQNKVMIFSDRKHPPHLTTLDRDAVILLLTVCTRNRRKILAHEWVHQLIRRSWIQCSDYSVGRYVIMPEHIHVFVGEGNLSRYRLEHWVAAWKSFLSRRWPDVYEKPIWQRRFWDRQIRSSDEYDQKWLYVRNNPVRHGLVENADEWPFQGSINILS